MSTREKTTDEIESEDSPRSMLPATVESRTESSLTCSDELSKGTSQLLSSAVTYVERLNNLMHSQFEQMEKDYLEEKEPQNKLSDHHLDIIKTLGPEIREGMKVAAQVAALRTKIERGEQISG